MMGLISLVGEVDFPFTAVHWVGEVSVVGEVSLPFTGWVGRACCTGPPQAQLIWATGDSHFDYSWANLCGKINMLFLCGTSKGKTRVKVLYSVHTVQQRAKP